MQDIYEAVIDQYRKGHTSVLATIIKQAGPSPRGIGAKCLLTEGGVLFGTVGGGRLEAEVLAKAPDVLESNLPELLSFHLKGTDVEDTDMLCGGDVEVFLEPVSPEEPDVLPMFGEVIKAHKRGGAGLLATIVDPGRRQSGRRLFLKNDGTQIGGIAFSEETKRTLRNRMDGLLRRRLPETLTLTEGERTLDIFVEPIVSGSVLYVFGGGHVSQQIVPLAARVGFEVVVIDDREDVSDARLFPEAGRVLLHRFEDVMEDLPIDAFSYLVIVTRGHSHDKEVLSQALKTDARYVGMIGSRRKRDIIYQKLLEEGLSQDDLARVHSPIGLTIGAETPEEIAVSVVAELIQVRAGQKPLTLLK
jgi:xanthine dehydrogenase accessory factor